LFNFFKYFFALLSILGLSPVFSQHDHHGPVRVDERRMVEFPGVMQDHLLANMRDHLLAISEIQEAMGLGNYDKATQIAEERLGQSSLKTHGAYENSKFMPQAMQELGNQMHRSASQFAIELQNASATGDVKPALLALSHTTQACVSCHAGFRIK
jgi:hypothetical protein